MPSDPVTPAAIDNLAAFLRGLKDLTKPQGLESAKRMLEKAAEWQRPLTRPEFDACIEDGKEAAAREGVVEMDPERTIEYDE